MRRTVAALLAFVACSACASERTPKLPFADAPGTIHAPIYSPPPSPRGVPPTQLSIPGGIVCNDRRLTGKRIARIPGRIPACGIANPVKVTAVAGVKLTAPIRVNCQTASALADWTEQHAKPAAAKYLNSPLTKIRPVASYACRTRNHKKGAKISEHGKGNAVDIAGFTFANGEQVTVLRGWNGRGGDFLKSVWRSACSDFGTVLGPNADKYHLDHFHFDTAKHRGGPYCR
ncbi:MAG: extensin family protein [Pikeienuella sp.]